MNSDRDIEQRIEDWLDAEARPMPQEVMESSLEAVARTAQVSGHSRWPAWTRTRFFSLSAVAVAAVLVVVAGVLALDRLGTLLEGVGSDPSSTQQEALTWDAAAEFRRAPSQMNPSPDSHGNGGVWSYRRSTNSAHDPLDYVLLPTFDADRWQDANYVNLFIGIGAAEGTLYLHPWSDGAVRKHAVLGWTSPIAGEVAISGAVSRVQGDCEVPSANVIFSIDRGAAILHTIAVDVGQSATFDLTATVSVGETLYFVFDADSDARCDLTALRLVIQA